jgi:hypothetical protein
MADTTTAEPGRVPITGVGEELDRLLSARFVTPFELQVGRGEGRSRLQRWSREG